MRCCYFDSSSGNVYHQSLNLIKSMKCSTLFVLINNNNNVPAHDPMLYMYYNAFTP